ncbi:flagellar export chaperone FlgN [Peribacillus frigoritolerans]|uniref:flagellar export chaperone FlgN n=1 Tax=Peribacillus TaxID=2675229 RepID=UPI000BA5C7A9|nr:flagellar export chaperone FlgN [Peribacillus simplex]PAL13698.1 hypothetical protein B8W99_09045 [Peribacillus simplex]
MAIRKTAILKANDTEAITALLISEQKHIKAISQTDKERERAVEEFLAANGTAGCQSSSWDVQFCCSTNRSITC